MGYAFSIDIARWRATAWQARYEILAVAAITAIGLFLRVWQLGDTPPGLHGDEGSTGLEARRILSHGWIGVYDLQHGLGQPAGAEYWTAGIVWLFHNDVFFIRFAMAIIGVATLPLAYLLYRLIGGRTVALIATALLAFSEWHLHFSRLALPPITMVFIEVLATLLLLAALRTKSVPLFVASGVAVGLGTYTYNSYPYFALALAAFVLYWLFRQRAEVDRPLIARIALSGALAFLVVIPMARFAFDHDQYFDYARSTSIFSDYRYEQADGFGKVDVVLDSGRDFVRRAVFDAKFDDTDGVGVAPLLDPVTAVLLGIGILIALRRWRDPNLMLCLIMLVVLSLPGTSRCFAGFHGGRSAWCRSSRCWRRSRLHRSSTGLRSEAARAGRRMPSPAPVSALCSRSRPTRTSTPSPVTRAWRTSLRWIWSR